MEKSRCYFNRARNVSHGNTDDFETMLKCIQEHCRAISSFSLSEPFYPDEFIDLLKSYCDQVMFAKANIKIKELPALTALATECPNVIFEFSRYMKIEYVMALQSRINYFKFNELRLDLIPDGFFKNCKLLIPDGFAYRFLTEFLRV